MILNEGGNVFKDKLGNSLTRRINRDEIPGSIRWLEHVTGLDFSEDKDANGVPLKWLGTTGRKDSSGDLDLSVDETAIDKETLVNTLLANGVPKEAIKKSGDSVHVLTPINGSTKNGFVQADLMFGDPKWQQFAMQGGHQGSQLTGMSRHVILASIVSAINPELKWSYKNGLVDRATNQTIDKGRLPKTLSDVTGIPVAKLNSADDIIEAIKKRPDYEKLIAAARETLAKSNIRLPEGAPTPGSAAWFRDMLGTR